MIYKNPKFKHWEKMITKMITKGWGNSMVWNKKLYVVWKLCGVTHFITQHTL